ncbi:MULTISPECIES: phosphoglycerate dehydrogenase [unclassified Microbacterium]|uniref:phosphoglycerate dehydrogenase n=1 Tax=unclassified Microbacterium TaxID=2609290 RepID=UPI003655DBAA
MSYAPALEAADDVGQINALIAGTEPVTADALALAPRLRIIVRTGVGYDSVDVDAATAQGVVVCTTPGANRRSVAELVVGQVFNGARRIAQNVAEVRAGRWERRSGREVAGSVLGIVGLGSIGKTVAELALALGMVVVAADPFEDHEFATRTGVRYLPLERLLRESDFVTLHVMLTAESRGLIDEYALSLMKSTAYLINTARGGIVDEVALAAALRSGQLSGAALDVLEEEPLPAGSELSGIDGLSITAHIAGATTESRSRSASSAAEQIIGFFDGVRPAGQVNLLDEASASAALFPQSA